MRPTLGATWRAVAIRQLERSRAIKAAQEKKHAKRINQGVDILTESLHPDRSAMRDMMERFAAVGHRVVWVRPENATSLRFVAKPPLTLEHLNIVDKLAAFDDKDLCRIARESVPPLRSAWEPEDVNVFLDDHNVRFQF